MLVREEEGDKYAEQATQHEDESIATFASRSDDQLLHLCAIEFSAKLVLFRLGPVQPGPVLVVVAVARRGIVLARAAAQHIATAQRGMLLKRAMTGTQQYTLFLERMVDVKKVAATQLQESISLKSRNVYLCERERDDRRHMAIADPTYFPACSAPRTLLYHQSIWFPTNHQKHGLFPNFEIRAPILTPLRTHELITLRQ